MRINLSNFLTIKRIYKFTNIMHWISIAMYSLNSPSTKLSLNLVKALLGQGTLPAKLSISHAHGTAHRRNETWPFHTSLRMPAHSAYRISCCLGRYRGNDRRANFDCVKVLIKSPRSQKICSFLRWLSPLYSVQYDELVVRARINTSSYSYS